MARWILVAALGFGCSGDETKPPAEVPESDTDTDTDADADADTDADTDADSDTDADTDTDADADTDTDPGPEAVDCQDAGRNITLEEFRQLYRRVWCGLWNGTCAQGGAPCAPDLPGPCGWLDEQAACACIDGAWECDPITGAPVPPTSCVEACVFDQSTTLPPEDSGAPTGDDDDDDTLPGGSGA